MDKFSKKLDLAERGRAFWIKLQAEVGSKLILFTWAENETLNQLALTHLPTLLTQEQRTGAVILGSGTTRDLWAESALGESVIFRDMGEEDRESLLAYYGLYQFTPDLYIISLERPFGSKLSHLLQHGSSEEDILKHCIYNMK